MSLTIFTTPGISQIMRCFSVMILKMTGWKLEGDIPPSLKKCVVIAAPHTSNWDLPNMLMVAFALRLSLFWIGKDSIFKFPFHTLMVWLGGIPVDRKKSNKMVELSAQTIRNAEGTFFLVIAPEGTRQRVSHWKTGFYYIALEAKVPIVMAYMDYSKKKSGIGKIFYPTGNRDVDMLEIQAFYSHIKGKNPSQFTS